MYFAFHVSQKNYIIMNWKTIAFTALAVIVGLVVYDKFIKKMVSGFEGGLSDFDSDGTEIHMLNKAAAA